MLCLGLAALGAAWAAPQQARIRFGNPSPALGPVQIASLSLSLLAGEQQLHTPADPDGDSRRLTIAPGASADAVIQQLAAAGLIAAPQLFRSYLVYTGIDTQLQAGTYTLSPAMTPIEIAQSIRRFSGTEVRFNVLAGWRMEEIAAALPTSGLNISPQDFLSIAKRRPGGYTFSAGLPQRASAEGFLHPGAYTLPRQTTASELLATLLGRFDAQVDAQLRDGFASQGLSLYEAVTLAAIVERETVIPEELPVIASVFLNRLHQGMMLQADPTVQYALGFDQAWGWWKSPLALSDLEVQSPYNTYLHPGLPPGPIANPGLEALRAVAFPEQTGFLYFRADCDGSGRHIFARTFEEHQANACP